MGNKIADKITKVSKTKTQNNSVTNEQKILDVIGNYRERNIYLQKKYRPFWII